MEKEKKVKLKTEEEVKSSLGIETFDNMPLKKMKDFMLLLPKMDKELAARCMEQFPEFKAYAEETLKYLQAVFSKVVESANSVDKKAIDSYQGILDDLSWQLKQPNLSIRQQRNIINQQVDVADKIAKLAERHKKFLWKMAILAVNAAAVVTGVAIFVLSGGKR